MQRVDEDTENKTKSAQPSDSFQRTLFKHSPQRRQDLEGITEKKNRKKKKEEETTGRQHSARSNHLHPAHYRERRDAALGPWVYIRVGNRR